MSIIKYDGESKVIKRICELLDTMTGISFVVVQTLPTVDIQTNVIYLVPKTTTEVDNIYDEYINTDGTSQGWELIGTTEIDLTNYVQFSDLSTVATSGDYDDLIDKPTIPTSLSQLSDDSTHRLVTDTEKSTWNGKAETSDISNAIALLDGVVTGSPSASKTLTAFSETDGKVSATFGDININIGQISNTCIVGTNDVITEPKTWYKVASTTITTTNSDATIVLTTNDTYNYNDYDCNAGILYCRVRQNSLGTIAYAKLKFIANSGFDTDLFKLYVTINSGTSITAEIWTRIPQVRYMFRSFTMISQGNRQSAYRNLWTLNSTSTSSNAPTESATCIKYDCEDISLTKVDWVSNGKLGAKNLIPLTVDEIKRNSGGTWVGNVRQINGVSFEILTDSYGYVTGIKANGTASARANLWLYNYTNKLFMGLKSDKYILSKSGKTGTGFGFCYYQNTTWVTQTNAITSDAEVTLDTNSATYNCIGIVLTIEKNTVCSNDIFKPMLRYAFDNDDTFQPYAMTNQELTKKANWVDLGSTNTGTITVNDVYSEYTAEVTLNCTYGGTTYTRNFIYNFLSNSLSSTAKSFIQTAPCQTQQISGVVYIHCSTSAKKENNQVTIASGGTWTGGLGGTTSPVFTTATIQLYAKA